jgi:hypothetical protein
MDRLTESSQPENVAHFYGFTWWMKAIYLAAAAITVISAILLIAHGSGPGSAERIWHWIEAFACALSGVYFAVSAFCSSVLMDDYSVNVRGVFFTSSLPRQSIQWCSRASTQWIPCTILYLDAPETKKLTVVHCYRFDDEWERWIASLKRLPS